MIIVVLLAIGAAGGWFYQDRLRALLPSTELNGLISRAQKALAENRLVGTQGDSARELFQSARALDPDNDQVKKGLDNVGTQLVEQARAALAHNDLATARADLTAAEEVLGGGPEVEQLKAALHSAETGNPPAEQMLQRADAALAAGKLLGDDSASVLYQRVLDADSTNALAQNGLKKVAEALSRHLSDVHDQAGLGAVGRRGIRSLSRSTSSRTQQVARWSLTIPHACIDE